MSVTEPFNAWHIVTGLCCLIEKDVAQAGNHEIAVHVSSHGIPREHNPIDEVVALERSKDVQ